MKKTALALLLAAILIGAALLWRASRTLNDQQLIQSLPQARATHVFLNIDGLRRSGLLDLIAGSRSAEDPDYKTFVAETGLDYRTDLDAVAAAFAEGNTYMVLRGNFAWKKLQAYAQSHGGKCSTTPNVCSMPASRNGFFISFTPMRAKVLALSVSARRQSPIKAHFQPSLISRNQTAPCNPL